MKSSSECSEASVVLATAFVDIRSHEQSAEAYRPKTIEVRQPLSQRLKFPRWIFLRIPLTTMQNSSSTEYFKQDSWRKSIWLEQFCQVRTRPSASIFHQLRVKCLKITQTLEQGIWHLNELKIWKNIADLAFYFCFHLWLPHVSNYLYRIADKYFFLHFYVYSPLCSSHFLKSFRLRM